MLFPRMPFPFTRALMRLLFTALALSAALTARAQALEPLPDDWDFTLPSLDGGRFITASQEPGPLLINFWSVDCAPCLAEMPLLQQLADGPSGWRVLLVTADTPAAAARAMQRVGSTLPVARGGKGLTALMTNGRPCARHAGQLDQQTLPALLAQCPHAAAPQR